MDCTKMGALIRKQRLQKGLSQNALAEKLCITGNAVSKWERGLGCPDMSLIAELTAILGIGAETLLSGEMATNDQNGGNMKKLAFYICPDCGNVITAESEAAIHCCGKKLEQQTLQKPDDSNALSIETLDDELYITSNHEMTKTHYISFIATLTGDTLILRKLYPEWNLETRLPRQRYGTLIYYCTQHGLFSQTLR